MIVFKIEYTVSILVRYYVWKAYTLYPHPCVANHKMIKHYITLLD